MEKLSSGNEHEMHPCQLCILFPPQFLEEMKPVVVLHVVRLFLENAYPRVMGKSTIPLIKMAFQVKLSIRYYLNTLQTYMKYYEDLCSSLYAATILVIQCTR